MIIHISRLFQIITAFQLLFTLTSLLQMFLYILHSLFFFSRNFHISNGNNRKCFSSETMYNNMSQGQGGEKTGQFSKRRRVNRTLSSFLWKWWWVFFPVMLTRSNVEANSGGAHSEVTALLSGQPLLLLNKKCCNSPLCSKDPLRKQAVNPLPSVTCLIFYSNT